MIDRESLRPAFERAYPMPESMAWIAPTGTYMSLYDKDGSLHEAHRYRGRWEGFCAAFESLGEPVGHFIEADIEYGVEAGWMELNEHGRSEFADKAVPLYRLPEVKA